MKAMILSDFIIIKNLLPQQILITVVVAVLVALGMSSIYAIIPAVIFMGAFTATFNLVAMDESNNWERYRLSLPLSRTQIVTGRYAFTFIFTLASIAMGYVIALVLIVIVQILGDAFPFPELSKGIEATSWPIMGILSAVSLAGIQGFVAITFPLMFRFGMNRAVRFIPVVFFAVIFGASTMLFSQGGLATGINDFVAQLSTPEGILVAVVVSLLGGAIIYGISCLASTKLYKGREF